MLTGRKNPLRPSVLVPSGFTLGHPGVWKVVRVAPEDITELGPTLEVPWLEVAPLPAGDSRRARDP
jgi:hypothetical protein